jgi:hypothetical protein
VCFIHIGFGLIPSTLQLTLLYAGSHKISPYLMSPECTSTTSSAATRLPLSLSVPSGNTFRSSPSSSLTSQSSPAVARPGGHARDEQVCRCGLAQAVCQGTGGSWRTNIEAHNANGRPAQHSTRNSAQSLQGMGIHSECLAQRPFCAANTWWRHVVL